MTNSPKRRRAISLMIVLLCLMAACKLGLAETHGQQPETTHSTAAPQDGPSLIIQNESDLPDTFPHASYEVHFRAHGGVPVLHWRLEKGALPQGLRLEDDGQLHGQPERAGEFQFTISVRDGGKPQQAVQKIFVLHVRSGLTLNWKTAARVKGNRIEGSVEVSNATPDDRGFDFCGAGGRGEWTSYGHRISAFRVAASHSQQGITVR